MKNDAKQLTEQFKAILRHIPGSCCPEKDCSVGSWDGKHCRSCGADCSKCPLNGLVEE